MIPYKEYKQVKAWCDQLGIKSNTEEMRKIVKLLEKYAETIVPGQKKQIETMQFEKRKNKVPHGYVPVNKAVLNKFLNTCAAYISDFDKLMASPPTYERGGIMAKLLTILNNELYLFKQYNISYNTSLEGRSEYEKKLLEKFYKEQDDLILKAAFDDTKRRNLHFIIGIGESVGGTVTYNKKECRFTELSYSINGCGETIDL